MANAVYEVIIKDPSTDDIWELIPRSYNFTETLNKEPKATFTFSFEEIKKTADTNDTTVVNMFTAALREIYISRNGTKIFYGVITDFDVDPEAGGSRKVTVKAMGFFGLFKKRIIGIGVEEYYSTTDAGDIAWDLIDNSQLDDYPYSDWGITEGSITASKNRDRGYLFDNLYDSIIKLSNDNLADGFDFDIDNTKQFNVYYPTKGTSRPNVVFDDRTMNKWAYSKQLISGMVNQVHVLGEGFNDDILYETRTAGTSYRTPFGTLEEKLDARNVSVATTLQDKGDKRLALAKDPVITVKNVEHFDDGIAFTDYNLGDTVVINLPELAVNSVSKRVRERTFTMKTPDSIGLCKIVLE